MRHALRTDIAGEVALTNSSCPLSAVDTLVVIGRRAPWYEAVGVEAVPDWVYVVGDLIVSLRHDRMAVGIWDVEGLTAWKLANVVVVAKG